MDEHSKLGQLGVIGGVIFEAATLVAKGESNGDALVALGKAMRRRIHGKRDALDAAWFDTYGETMPEPIAALVTFPGGRGVVLYSSGRFELRKMPGGEGPSMIEKVLDRGVDNLGDLFDTLLGGK